MLHSRLIKRRIKAAKNISQITKAMEMVSAAKMRKAESLALINRNYSQKLFEITKELIKSSKAEGLGTKNLYVVISPNKGLCGSLITNLIKKILETIKTEKETASFLSIGKKATGTLTKFSQNLVADFDFGIRQPKYEQIIPVAKLILGEFQKGTYQSVFVIYSDFVSTLIQRPMIKMILPIKKEESDLPEPIDYIFEPSKKEILTSLIPYYVENQLFQLVLEAYASEQSARMMAMKNATDNATEIMKELTLVYNSARQMQITNEIADIATAGMAI